MLGVLACVATVSSVGRVGQTPPMGFNPWNELARHYPPWGSGLNETNMVEVAKAIVSALTSWGFHEHLQARTSLAHSLLQD